SKGQVIWLTGEDGPCLYAEMSSADSDRIEVLKEHEAFLEDFVTECGVTKNYNQHQNLSINSGITTWIDLVPRLKMTEAILIDHGVTHKLALRILKKAEGRRF
ncbi:hypothetical protein DFH28DRAFT_870261, partial [Melampsora americana]